MRISDWSSDVCSSDLTAWREKRTMAPLSGALAPVNMEEAFDVQEELARRPGRETAGWKLGLSCPAGMKTFKIDRPMSGRLFRDAMKGRSEERRSGKGCVSTCRSRW